MRRGFMTAAVAIVVEVYIVNVCALQLVRGSSENVAKKLCISAKVSNLAHPKPNRDCRHGWHFSCQYHNYD